MAGAGGDASYLALVDILPGKLMRAAKESIRRAANGKVLLASDAPQLLAFLQRKHQRLFRIDVITRLECRLRHGKMRGGNSEVHHHVDVLVGEEFLDRLRRDTKFFCPQFRRIAVKVGAGQHLDALEERCQRKVSRRDVAAPDDADAQFPLHDETPD